MQWKQTIWMLIPITGMSMLAVLFIVLWQAITHQTDSINQLQTRMDDLELKLETNPSVSTQLLEQQLKQLQSNQRSLEAASAERNESLRGSGHGMCRFSLHRHSPI